MEERRKIKLAVLASGRGTNFQAIIDACERGQIDAEVALVVSDNPEAYALERARRHGIKALYIPPGKSKTGLDPEREQEYIETIKQHGVDLVCLAGFMRVVPPNFVEAFRWRMINIHPSLLPSFRGLEAQEQAWEYGVKIAGCTVHFVDEGVDTGPVILQAAVPVMEEDTPESLAARVLEQEHRIYPQAIQLFAEGRLVVEGRRVRILPPGPASKVPHITGGRIIGWEG